MVVETEKTRRFAQSTYNPVTHTGCPAVSIDAPPKRPGLRSPSTAIAATHNLQGSACIPKEGAEVNKATSRPNSLLHLPARVDHLAGAACRPDSAACSGNGSSSAEHVSAHNTANKAKILTLRAAVDNLSGEACAVRQVDVVATLDAPPPAVVRGMATRLVRDRQIAQTAKEHMMSSCLYQPGAGYTKPGSGSGEQTPSAD